MESLVLTTKDTPTYSERELMKILKEIWENKDSVIFNKQQSILKKIAKI